MTTTATIIRQLVLCALVAMCSSSSYGNDNNSQQWSSSYYPNPDLTEQERGSPPNPPTPEGGPSSAWYQGDERAPPVSDQPPPQYGRPDTGNFTPINYQFQSRQPEDPQNARRGFRGEQQQPARADDGIPVTSSFGAQNPADFDSDAPKTATARQDAITKYMSTFKGRLALRSSSALVGTALGGFIFKSILNTPTTGGLLTGLLLVLLTFVRSPYGELSRALGLTLIFVWQRTFSIRRRYPTWPHIKSSLGAGPRMAFPRGDDFQSGQIRYVYTLIAMGFVGSACGGNLPLVPTWLGALGGAGILVVLSTLRSSRGDLARSMGMRVVAVLEELLDINTELKVVQKSGVVAGKILDKVLILDSKHRIKDRIASGLTFAYEQVSRTAGQINDRGKGDDGDSERRRDDRDDDRRRDDRRRNDDRRGGDNGRRQDDDRRGGDSDRRRGDDRRDRQADDPRRPSGRDDPRKDSDRRPNDRDDRRGGYDRPGDRGPAGRDDRDKFGRDR